MFKPKVSVIIAAYNSEQYIRKCLDSVTSQTLKSIEVIIVDDGSSDLTASIINEYANCHKQIKAFFNETNRGAGHTKNLALSKAQGKYIGFLDSDDYINRDYFKKLYSAAKKYNADIACADIALEYPDKIIESKLLANNMYIKENNEEIRPSAFPHKIPKGVIFAHWASASASTKIFKRELILRFPFSESTCDDLPAVLSSVAYAKTTVYVPGLIYFYVQRLNSLERSKNSERYLEIAKVINITLSLIKEREPTLAAFVVVNNLYSVLMQITEIGDFNRRLSILLEARSYLVDFDIEDLLDVTKNKYLKYVIEHQNMGSSFFYHKVINLFAKGDITLANQYIEQWKDKKESYRPKVSIVIPVYNGANYMREAIGSALAQTYSNLEVIVINDGSNDNGETERIAFSYGDRIRYFYKENGGVASALNLGIEKMTGEYFSWLSHDDMYTYDKLEKQINVLATLTDKTTILTGGYSIIDSGGKHLYDVDPRSLYPADVLNNSLRPLFRGCIHGCALLIHKSHFERVGVFNTDLPTTQDYDLFFRILRGQKLKFHKGLYVLSRSHDEQDSKKSINSHIDECNRLWINMMETLTDEEKCSLEGSTYNFYKSVYDFLRTSTAYHEVILYSRNRAFEEARKRLTSPDGQLSNNKRYAFIKEVMNFIGLSQFDNPLSSTVREILESPKTQKRIVFLLGDINSLGGLNRVVFQIAGQLCDCNEVFLVYSNKFSGEGYSFDPRLKEIMLPFGPTTDEYRDSLAKLLRLIDIDIFIVSYNCSSMYLKLYSKIQQYGIRTIAWNHEFYFFPYWNSDLNECLPEKNEALSQANAVIWLNSFSANIYSLLHQNTAIIPNPLTIELPEYKDVISRPKNIIAIGRFDDSNKGLTQLLYTYSAVLKKYPNTELWIIGPVDMQISDINMNLNMTYEQLIKTLKLPIEKVHITGWVKNVEDYLQKACVHIRPSRYEGFGLTITEAGAYGIPSVVFEGSGSDDIITNNEDGFIVPQGDFKEMASRVIDLLENEVLLSKMSKAAYKMAKRYEISNITAKWDSLINAVMTLEGEKLNNVLKNEFMVPVKDEKAFTQWVVAEYDRCVNHFASITKQICYVETASFQAEEPNPYIAEVYAMQRSFSWRVTKPLRWAKKILMSLKKNGLIITMKKVVLRFKIKFKH